LENITADTRQYKGIHPIVALDSHRENLAKLVDKALRSLPAPEKEDDNAGKTIRLLASHEGGDAIMRKKPDFISVTRGPGMRSNLSTGLDTAKGLSVAWQIPLVGVHHMQAHLLTPRLVSALENTNASTTTTTAATATETAPDFPFLSILVSGGHSLLAHSSSVTDHSILASTSDIAIGAALDKVARLVLPPSLLATSKTTMYGKILEDFAFPNGPADYKDYQPPSTRGEEITKRVTEWGWSIALPFAETRTLEFSFAGVASRVTKLMTESDPNPSLDQRIALARESMRICFEHLASRTVIALQDQFPPSKDANQQENIKTLVLSGGVAANKYLRKVLRSFLDVRGFQNVEVVAPPAVLCTDNAAMIGWAGIEMFEGGWRSDLSCRAWRKWSLDPGEGGDGGVLGPADWRRVE
jgi:N6-L-threonylcarbamoyladenine synthase